MFGGRGVAGLWKAPPRCRREIAPIGLDAEVVRGTLERPLRELRGVLLKAGAVMPVAVGEGILEPRFRFADLARALRGSEHVGAVHIVSDLDEHHARGLDR